MTELSIRALERNEEELQTLVAAFARNKVMVPAGIDYYRWLYFENPVGRVLIDVAVDPDAERIAGVYASLPNVFSVDGRDVIGIQSLDSLTDIDYRRRGLFLRLANSLYARVEKENVALVYGFPNNNSAPPFFKNLQWKQMDPVPLMVRPLGLRQNYLTRSRLRLRQISQFLPKIPLPILSLHRLPAADSIAPLDGPFDTAFDGLWANFAKTVGIAVARRHDYLNWRLKAAPHQTYQTLTYRRGDELLGFVSYCVVTKDGASIGRIMDMISVNKSAAVALIGTALRNLARAGCEAVLAVVPTHAPTRAAFARHFFVPAPRQLHGAFHFGARKLAWTGPLDPESPRDWYISYCDMDTV
jgi:Acetyltransferase (GNAT) domain